VSRPHGQQKPKIAKLGKAKSIGGCRITIALVGDSSPNRCPLTAELSIRNFHVAPVDKSENPIPFCRFLYSEAVNGLNSSDSMDCASAKRRKLVVLPEGLSSPRDPIKGVQLRAQHSGTGEWIDLILLECVSPKQNIHFP
jgi:hypothetical protein